MEEAIKLWVGRILGRPIRDLTVVRDVALAREMLQRLEPGHFRLGLQTIDLILQAMTEYYRTVHRIDITAKVKSLRQRMDVLGMWELLLGIAIKCPEKNTYIQMILNLDEQSQRTLMSLINMITQDCPQMSMTGSSIEDGKDQKLQAALLLTIDELTEENNQIKERLEILEEQMELEKTTSEQKITELKQQLEELRSERLEVLGQYEAQYCSESLLSIFKSMEEDRDQLRIMLQSRESTIAALELRTSEMVREYDRMKNENREMKRDNVKIKELQLEAEQAQRAVKELRNRETKYVEQICQLQQARAHLRRTLTRTIETNQVCTIGDLSRGNSQTQTTVIPDFNKLRESERTTTNFTELPNEQSRHSTATVQESTRSTTIRRELKPFVKEQSNTIKVKELQRVIEQLNGSIGDKDNEIEELQNRQIRKQQKIEDLESRCANIERLNQVYSQNIKEKEVFVASKQGEYQTKFSELLVEIESLKFDEKKLVDSVTGIKQDAEVEKENLKEEYDRKLGRVIKMLEDQLLEFRDKELAYLETIRQINSKITKLQNTTREVQREVVVAESNHTHSTELVIDPAIVEQLEMAIRQIEVLNKKNMQLNEDLSATKLLLEGSLGRQSRLLEQVGLASKTLQDQSKQVQQLRECSLKYMRCLLDERRSKQRVGEPTMAEGQSKSSEEQLAKLQLQYDEIQRVISEIEAVRVASIQQARQFMDLQQIPKTEITVVKQQQPITVVSEEKKAKIIAYFEDKLRRINDHPPFSSAITKEPEAISHIAESNSHQLPTDASPGQTEFEQILRTLEAEEQELRIQRQSYTVTIEQLTVKVREKQQIVEKLSNQLSSLALQLQSSKQESAYRTIELDELKQKCYRLESTVMGKVSDNSEMASFVNKLDALVDEMTKLRQSELNQRQSTQQLKRELDESTANNVGLCQRLNELSASSSLNIQIRALRQANTKLIEQTLSQKKTTQLFRKRYAEMHEKCSSLLQQNEVLVCAIADMRTSLRTRIH